MAGLGVSELIVILASAAMCGVSVVVPFWRIFSRTGLPGAMSLMMLVPAVNVAALFYLAYTRWPALDGRRG